MSEPAASQIILGQQADTKTVDKPADTLPVKQEDVKVETSNVNINDFLNITGESQIAEIADRKEPSKETIQTKPEISTELESKQTSDEKEKTKESEVEQSKIADEVADEIRKGKKDYTDIEEKDIPLFSKMGLKSFEYFKPLYLQHRKLVQEHTEAKTRLEKLEKGAPPDNYFEHERGYTLTPEFESAADKYSKAQIIADHWNQQLENIRKGEETYQEIQLNQQGDLVLSKPIVATKSSEDEVRGYLQFSQQQFSKVGAQLEIFAASHRDKSRDAIKLVKDFENDSFKAFTGDAGKKLEPVVRDTMVKLLPPIFHNNPLASGYVKALITLHHLNEQYKKLQGTTAKEGASATTTNGSGTTTTTKTQDKVKAGPNNSSMASGDSSSKGGEVSIQDFEEYTSSRR
jgi:hypothetical protein